jgi:hypothetical protein
MEERNSSPEPYAVKVVVLAQGNKEKKSVASLLMGDTFDLESESVLLCSQRGFAHAVVKVGKLIGDGSEDAVAEGSTVRRIRESLRLSDRDTSPTVERVLGSPIVLSTSRVDVTECTRVTAAVQAMLRAANYPLQNTSFAILSTPASGGTEVSQEVWNDEFGRLIGPELLRLPLLYASTQQAVARITRAVLTLQEKGSGLVTPIAVERYSNGVRILFRPKDSTYTSYKEEKKLLNDYVEPVSKNEEKVREVSVTKPSGYISPETLNMESL